MKNNSGFYFIGTLTFALGSLTIIIGSLKLNSVALNTIDVQNTEFSEEILKETVKRILSKDKNVCTYYLTETTGPEGITNLKIKLEDTNSPPILSTGAFKNEDFINVVNMDIKDKISPDPENQNIVERKKIFYLRYSKPALEDKETIGEEECKNEPGNKDLSGCYYLSCEITYTCKTADDCDNDKNNVENCYVDKCSILGKEDNQTSQQDCAPDQVRTGTKSTDCVPLPSIIFQPDNIQKTNTENNNLMGVVGLSIIQDENTVQIDTVQLATECPDGKYPVMKQNGEVECQFLCAGESRFNRETELCECPNQSEPYYRNGRCIQCPENTTWNNNERSCDCEGGKIWNFTSNQCECPPYKPKSILSEENGVEIVKCVKTCPYQSADGGNQCVCFGSNPPRRDDLYYWRAYEKMVSGELVFGCHTCAPNQHYIGYGGPIHGCSDCPRGQYHHNGGCHSCSSSRYYNGRCNRCRRGRHYYNSRCHRCPQGQHEYAGGCHQCPRGQHYYNSRCNRCPSHKPHYYSWTLKCHRCPYGQHYYNNRCNRCPIGQQYEYEGRCNRCPQGQQYYYDRICRRCPPSQHYYNNRCNRCPQGQHYYYLRCNRCPIGYYYYYGRCNRCPRNQYEYNNACHLCPQGQHWNKWRCIRCPQGHYWYNNQCNQCAEGLVLYNGTCHSCQYYNMIPFRGRCCRAEYVRQGSCCPYNFPHERGLHQCCGRHKSGLFKLFTKWKCKKYD